MRSRWINGWWVGAALAAGTAAAAPPPPEYEAVYSLARNGKPTAEMVVRLDWRGDTWSLVSETVGQHGLARVLAVRSRDEASGGWRDGRPVPGRFEHKLTMRGPDQGWRAQFDHGAGLVRTVTEDGPFEFDADDDVFDPGSLQLGLRAALEDGIVNWPVRIVDEDELEAQSWVAEPVARRDTALGCLDVRPVRREKPGSSRFVSAWHAPRYGYLPVRVEQGKRGEDVNLATLKRLTWDGRVVTPVAPCGSPSAVE